MCSFEFQSCQETAPGRCSCAAVAYLTYAYIWRGRGLEVQTLLLLPSQSELLGWQGCDEARIKNGI